MSTHSLKHYGSLRIKPSKSMEVEKGCDLVLRSQDFASEVCSVIPFPIGMCLTPTLYSKDRVKAVNTKDSCIERLCLGVVG